MKLLGLAQRQAEHGPQRQGCSDRQGRIRGLPAPASAWLGLPGLGRLRRESHGKTAAGAKAGVVRGPVGHPAPLLRNVMAPSGVQLERHEGWSCRAKEPCPVLTRPEASQAGDRCNKAAYQLDRIDSGDLGEPHRRPYVSGPNLFSKLAMHAATE